MIPLILQTMKKRYLTWLAYGVIGLGLVVLYVALFPALQHQAASFNQLLKSLPHSILKAFGADVSLDNVGGLLVSKQFGLVWPLMAAGLVISFAGSTLAGEIDSGTLALLLGLPLSRIKIYFSKFLAGVIGLVVFVLLSVAAIIPVAAAYNVSVGASDVWKLALIGLLFSFSILGMTMMFSAFFSDRGKVYATGGGTLLIMYVLNLIAALKSSLSQLQYVSLFYYYNAGSVLVNHTLDATSIVVLVGVAIVTSLVGAYWFQRRDISL
jgi:ABC-2 type transport system permease protein